VSGHTDVLDSLTAIHRVPLRGSVLVCRWRLLEAEQGQTCGNLHVCIGPRREGLCCVTTLPAALRQGLGMMRDVLARLPGEDERMLT
jgi:hypothetical protein